MKKYVVCCITKASKFIGKFEARSEDEAIEKAMKSDAYNNVGGLCCQCMDTIGDDEGNELVAFEVKP